MRNSLLRNGQSVIRQQECVLTYTYYNIAWKIKCTTPDTKTHSLDVAKKYVETYSPSSAAARNLEEEVQTNPKLHRKKLTKFDNSKPKDWLS